LRESLVLDEVEYNIFDGGTGLFDCAKMPVPEKVNIIAAARKRYFLMAKQLVNSVMMPVDVFILLI